MNLEKDTILEQGIKEYLKENGIEKLSPEKFETKLKERFHELKPDGNWVGFKLYYIDNPYIRELPEFYDIFMCNDEQFNRKLAFFKHLVQFVDAVPDTDTPINLMDSGCGSGDEVGFLAKRNEKRDHNYFGYDNQKGMIQLAEAKLKRLNLKNLRLYAGDHDSPERHEIASADILYNNGSVGLNYEGTHDENMERVKNILSRVKTGGIGIFSCLPSDFSELKHDLEKEGIEHLDALGVYDLNDTKFKFLYSNFFRVWNGDPGNTSQLKQVDFYKTILPSLKG